VGNWALVRVGAPGYHWCNLGLEPGSRTYCRYERHIYIRRTLVYRTRRVFGIPSDPDVSYARGLPCAATVSCFYLHSVMFFV
jgi:hypothetical protein